MNTIYIEFHHFNSARNSGFLSNQLVRTNQLLSERMGQNTKMKVVEDLFQGFDFHEKISQKIPATEEEYYSLFPPTLYRFLPKNLNFLEFLTRIKTKKFQKFMRHISVDYLKTLNIKEFNILDQDKFYKLEVIFEDSDFWETTLNKDKKCNLKLKYFGSKFLEEELLELPKPWDRIVDRYFENNSKKKCLEDINVIILLKIDEFETQIIGNLTELKNEKFYTNSIKAVSKILDFKCPMILDFNKNIFIAGCITFDLCEKHLEFQHFRSNHLSKNLFFSFKETEFSTFYFSIYHDKNEFSLKDINFPSRITFIEKEGKLKIWPGRDYDIGLDSFIEYPSLTFLNGNLFEKEEFLSHLIPHYLRTSQTRFEFKTTFQNQKIELSKIEKVIVEIKEDLIMTIIPPKRKLLLIFKESNGTSIFRYDDEYLITHSETKFLSVRTGRYNIEDFSLMNLIENVSMKRKDPKSLKKKLNKQFEVFQATIHFEKGFIEFMGKYGTISLFIFRYPLKSSEDFELYIQYEFNSIFDLNLNKSHQINVPTLSKLHDISFQII
eukprot:gene8475-297_t